MALPVRASSLLVAVVCALAPALALAERPVHGATEDGHAAEHGAPSFEDVNWFHGFVGEQQGPLFELFGGEPGDEPNFFFRRVGEPVPLGASVINTGLLFYVLYRLFGRDIAEGLRRRKRDLMHGIEEAERMRREAEGRLSDYETKLDRIDQEMDQAKQQMRELGQVERERVLAEARERRERMERDAKLLVDQELKVAHELLFRETVRGALRSAEESIVKTLGPADHERIAEEYLTTLRQAAGALRGRL